MQRLSPFVALLSTYLLAIGAHAKDQGTVPIFLPYYDAKSWSLVRGSVITSKPDETTYTIFCAPQTTPSCDLALELPFIFAEGDNTLRFEGTLTSTYTANLECKLGGTTAATCSAYSSLKSGFVAGLYTGPTEISWTSTLSGSEVQWGTLTLADQPSKTGTPDDVSGTAQATGDPNFTEDFLFDGTLPTSSLPVETGLSSGARLESTWLLNRLYKVDREKHERIWRMAKT
ncbi:hypothetical protein D7B24_008875 [Verticillium nonalfalfae]|uniref:Ubiquitin 3 binding protein But2 C-terminal domain-containing protein n=1 Tax=Verticillium nonalfalfae TaxID=1051616 RepID=A0A3M9Y3U9_9PEZI|nr:uncharacterized protein D7B24_008875 [Verticillium nonalfalfae]RNJ55179.1 hypothetical protein D7B24_008875 [Verticillium nonalfalfae]